MDHRLICYDCGAQLKHKKAIDNVAIEKLEESNTYRIFCKTCAKKRNLPRKRETKLSKAIRVFIGILIVASSIIFWSWLKNNRTGWHSTILAVGVMTITFLFFLYDELKQ